LSRPLNVRGGAVYSRYARPVTTRPLAVAALAAVLAAAGAAAVAWQGRPPAAPAPAPPRAPALELGLVFDDPLARDLRAAEQLWDDGSRAEARRRFEAALAAHPDSLEAAVGAAVAAWPQGALDRLQALAAEHPDSALVRLHLGLALFAAGRGAEAARTEWRAALARDPDTPAALRAEDLLHPDQAPGRPFYVPAEGLPADLSGLGPAEQLAALEERAEQGGAEEWLDYGVALQRVGRPVSAQAAFDRAAALKPDSVEALTAAAVARFTKADPSAAFSRLGPLARDNPEAAVVRFHLGVLLLWLRQVAEAREQLEQTRDLDTGGTYGNRAVDLLERLDEVGTS
jgi:tetratricopeptide (TPR) repeat protein